MRRRQCFIVRWSVEKEGLDMDNQNTNPFFLADEEKLVLVYAKIIELEKKSGSTSIIHEVKDIIGSMLTEQDMSTARITVEGGSDCTAFFLEKKRR